MPVGGHKNHKKGDEADQVIVVKILGFFQQKNVGEHQKESCGAHPVKETQGNAGGEDRHYPEVNQHAVARPGLDEIKGPVFEVKLLAYVKVADPAAVEVTPNLPEHDRAECDTEKNQGTGIHRRK